MASDIRTDACPSPPRDERNKTFLQEPHKGGAERAEEIHNLDEDEKTHRSPPRVPAAGKYKQRNFKKPTSKTKCDNVIYINQSKDIHIGSTTTYTVNVGSPQPKEAPIIYHQTQKIKKLLASNDAVSREHLIFLCGHISASSWKLMARKLGFSDGRIDQIYVDHYAMGIREVIYQCLLEWIQEKPTDAIISQITDVLWGCNDREAVDLFSHFVYPDK